jgi:prepilin-type processing-associated H-X9-DG protein
MNCQTNLKNIALATLNYESAKKVLPPAMQFSKRESAPNGPSFYYFILSYIEDQALYSATQQAVADFERANPNRDFDFGNASSPMYTNQAKIFTCPSDGEPFASEWVYNRAGLPGSNYAAVMGSAWSRAKHIEGNAGGGQFGGGVCADQGGGVDCVGGGTQRQDETANFDGPIYPMSAVKIGKITDGTSSTYMIGERWYILRVWGQGGYGTSQAQIATQRLPRGAPYIATGGTFIWPCKNITPEAPINANLNQVGFYSIHRDTDRPGPRTSSKNISSTNLPWGSFHSGGANFAYCDGSVHFETDDIDAAVYMAHGSRNGQDVGNEVLRTPVAL